MNESLTSKLRQLRLSGLAETLEVRIHDLTDILAWRLSRPLPAKRHHRDGQRTLGTLGDLNGEACTQGAMPEQKDSKDQ